MRDQSLALVALLASLTVLWFFPGRWQLYPAIAGFFVTFIRLRYFAPSRWRWRVFIFPLFATLVTWFLCYLMPIRVYPALTGARRVGTRQFVIKELKRISDEYGESAPRELVAQAWYPTDAKIGELADFFYLARDSWGAAAKRFHLPSFLGSYLALVRTRSWVDVPLAASAERLPVLLFSHGLLGSKVQDTFLAQELASRGYVVVAVDHLYDATVSAFPDGRLVITRALMPEHVSREDRAVRWNSWIRVRVADLARVTEELPNIFPGRLNLNKIGVFGHSLGGQTAAAFCASDSRCGVGVSLDGIPPASMVAGGGFGPFLFVTGESYFGGLLADRRPESRASIPALGIPPLRLEIAGMAHGNFTDLPLFSPIHRLTLLTGEIEGLRGLELLRDLLGAYFGARLKTKKAGDPGLEEVFENYPEIRKR